MNTPTCVKCALSMRCTNTGIYLELLNEAGSGYQIWSADLFKCAECGTAIADHYGRAPVAESHQKNYEEARGLFKPYLRFWRSKREKQHWECMRQVDVTEVMKR